MNPDTQEIVSQVLTDNSEADGDQVEKLVNRVEEQIEKLKGDGGYDWFKVHEFLQLRSIETIIPPQKNAKIKQHGNSKKPKLRRDELIRSIRIHGRKGWKKKSGYHERSLAEVAMYRCKTIFGEQMRSRLSENQKTETKIKLKILNRYTNLGMPEGEWVKIA